MQHHPDGGQGPREDTDAKRDSIDHSIQHRVQADTEQRNQSNGCLRRPIADIRMNEPVDQMKSQIARQQIEWRLWVHAEGMGNNMKEGYRDQYVPAAKQEK